MRDDDLTLLGEIRGDLPADAVELLYTAGKDWCVDEGVIVEIGAWQGLSTAALGLGSKRGNKNPVYSIDAHETMPGTDYGPHDWQPFYANLIHADAADMVRPIGLPYEHVRWPELPVTLLFVDVHPHTHENTIGAFNTVGMHLTENAVIILDDTDQPGVKETMKELGLWEQFADAGRVVALRRKWGVHDERELEAEATRQADEAEAPRGEPDGDTRGGTASDAPDGDAAL